MPQSLILHIGYAKSGTSLLQQRVFPNLIGVDYVGRHVRDTTSWMTRLLARLRGNPVRHSRPAGSLEHWTPIGREIHLIPQSCGDQNLQEQIRGTLRPWIERRRNTLLSHENILRPGLLHGLAECIRSIFADFDVRVIISIREQSQIIWSRYCHDLAVFGHDYTLADAMSSAAPPACIAPMCSGQTQECECHRCGIRPVPPDYYDYYALLQQFRQHFEPSQVLILPLELIASSPVQALNLLARFSGAEVPAGLPGRISDRVNARPGQRTQHAELLNPKSESILETLGRRYAASNSRLAGETGLDLRSLGYSVETNAPTVER